MAVISTDGKGIISFRDENGRLLFDRNTGVSVAGWSKHPYVSNKHKNIDETSGKAETREK